MSEVIQMEFANGRVVLFDPEDEELINQYRWRIAPNNKGTSANWYARSWGKRPDGTVGNFMMHRLLLNPPRHRLVDHINGNGLDNRRCNLRMSTPAQNTVNRIQLTPTHDGNPYRGVRARHNVFECTIAGQLIGKFDTAEDAALAYDFAAIEKYGEFAQPNFPRRVLERIAAYDARSKP